MAKENGLKVPVKKKSFVFVCYLGPWVCVLDVKF